MCTLQKIAMICLLQFFLAGALLAAPGQGQGGGKGLGKSMGASKGVNTPVSKSTTADFTGAHPPGLKSQPYGLMKKGKTPAGWSKGKKVGWSCSGSDNKQVCVDKTLKKDFNCVQVNGTWYCKD